MIAQEKIEHMKQMLDEADEDPAKRKLLGQRLFHAAGRLARKHKEITAEMVAEELVDVVCREPEQVC